MHPARLDQRAHEGNEQHAEHARNSNDEPTRDLKSNIAATGEDESAQNEAYDAADSRTPRRRYASFWSRKPRGASICRPKISAPKTAR